MTGLVVLGVLGGWSLWLVRRDVTERPQVSSAIWIVCAWAAIHGSRPVTSWFAGPDVATSYDEGNSGEAVVYLCLIAAGLMVLLRRRLHVPAVVEENRWLVVFYVFWLLSVVWSDYPVITLRRLVKDFGNVVMVLVILTDTAPGQAVKAVFVRLAYVCIPLSIVLIRYFPDVGRAYGGYDVSEFMYVGVTTHKNGLGALALVSALFVLWDLLGLRGRARDRSTVETITVMSRALVLMMCWYLLVVGNSATSLVCAVFGSLVLIGVHVPSVRRRPGRVEACAIGVMVVLWVLEAVFDVRDAFVQSLGRDMTLTTRTDVWPILIAHQDNPLVGAGFNSFWAGRRLVELQERVGEIIQAHNGYLETYLNGGVVAVALLAVLLCAAYRRIRLGLIAGAPEGWLRFAILLAVVIHNLSEASFNKLTVLWFVTVFALMDYRARPAPRQVAPERARWSPALGERRS